MERRAMLALGASTLSLAGCASFAANTGKVATTAGKVLATVETTVGEAVTNYTTLKGIGQVVLSAAGLVSPGAAAAIHTVIATADPILAKVEAAAMSAVAAAPEDVAALISAASQIASAAQGAFTATANAVAKL